MQLAVVSAIETGTTDRQRVQQWLQDWIANYVDSEAGTRESLTQLPKPLAAATISVEQAPENPTLLKATFHIRLND